MTPCESHRSRARQALKPMNASSQRTPDSARADFALISRSDSVYLDSAATTQKPETVLAAVEHYYRHQNANVHRAAHKLAEIATDSYESARDTVARFIGAARREEVLFTRGTTESINLVAACLTTRLRAGDEILISELEHHSNIVPWQMLAERTGATLKAARVTEAGEIDVDHFSALLSERTKLAAFGHVSNALGTVHPVRELTQLAKAAGALVLVDGAQATAHVDVDVQAIGCDFYALSGHKAYAPMGIGALWGRFDVLDSLPPWHGGGEMIEHVSIERSTWNVLPYKFEAGTPNVGGAVGLAAALDYLSSFDADRVRQHEADLVRMARSGLSQLPGVRIIGEPQEHTAVVSFVTELGHPQDIGTLLDQQGIAVRTGHHCTMPLMQSLGLPGTVRASFALYNDHSDAERLIKGVDKALSFL